MLQRHADAPQTALDQLIMLQSCVEDAAATAAGELPDAAAWESGSGSGSGSDEEHGLGASWALGATPQELAAAERGALPPAPLLQAAAAAAAAGGNGGLSPEKQLGALKAEFGSVPDRGLEEALAACDGDLFAAAELLRAFAAEDAAAAAAGSAGLNGGADRKSVV